MLLGIKARAEGTLGADSVLRGISDVGWIAATIGIAFVLFWRRRGWWWVLPALAYAALIIIFTADIWSAIAGFLWWGIITAGFLVFGRDWWTGLVLAIVIVILTLVLTPQPQLAFGVIFLLVTIGVVAIAAASSGRQNTESNGK